VFHICKQYIQNSAYKFTFTYPFSSYGGPDNVFPDPVFYITALQECFQLQITYLNAHSM